MENRTGAGHGASPQKGSVHRIIETVLLVPITDDLYRETGKVIRYRQTLTGSFTLLYRNRPFAVIFLPIRDRKGIHKISELQRCTVHSFERAVGHGRDCRIYPPEPFLKACPMQGAYKSVHIPYIIVRQVYIVGLHPIDSVEFICLSA